MAVGVDLSAVDPDSLPFQYQSQVHFPNQPSSVDQDLVQLFNGDWIIPFNRRRRSRKSFTSRHSSSSTTLNLNLQQSTMNFPSAASTSGMITSTAAQQSQQLQQNESESTPGLADISPFTVLLGDDQALDMWTQFVEMPEDMQSEILSRISNDNAPSTPVRSLNGNSGRRMSSTPVPTTPILPQAVQTSPISNSRKGSRRQRRRQRLAAADELFAFTQDDESQTPRKSSSDSDRFSTSATHSFPDLCPGSPASFQGNSNNNNLTNGNWSRTRRQSEILATTVTSVRVITVEPKYSHIPPTSHRLKQQQQSSHSTANSNEQQQQTLPIWLRRLKASDEVMGSRTCASSWSTLKLLEEYIRNALDDSPTPSSTNSTSTTTLSSSSGSVGPSAGPAGYIIEDLEKKHDRHHFLQLDPRQMRVGVKLNAKDPLSSKLQPFMHAIANYYQLTCSVEWSARGKKKKFVEGWLYLPTTSITYWSPVCSVGGSVVSSSGATTGASGSPQQQSSRRRSRQGALVNGNESVSSVGSVGRRKGLPDVWFVDAASKHLP